MTEPYIKPIPADGPPIDIDKEMERDDLEDHVRYMDRQTKALVEREGTLSPAKTKTLPPSLQRYKKHLLEDELIIDKIAEGGSIKKVLGQPGMPSLSTIQRWRDNDLYGFGTRFQRALRMRAHVLVDDLIDIADDDKIDPRDKRVRGDFRKWIAAKQIPEQYGDRTILSGDRDNPISVSVQVDLAELSDAELAALEAFTTARKDAVKDQKKPAIDVPFEDVTEED